ncbi:hypothetical protein ABXS75_11705 [Roseburia hominis]
MRTKKGEAGYIRSRKTLLMIVVLLEFALVGGLVFVGYKTTGTRRNLLTLVAILGCLPACRTLVNLIVMAPYHSINEARELEIAGVTGNLTVLYDLILTSERKSMPIQSIAIYNRTVCGYVSDKRIDTHYAARHIKSMLAQEKLDKVTVKLFTDYTAFLARAEGMDNIASVEQEDNSRIERKISRLLLDISL